MLRFRRRTMKKVKLSTDEQIVIDNFESRCRDLDWAIGLNRLSLRLMGVWPEKQANRTSIIKFLTVVMPIPTMIFSTICFIFLPQMYALTLVSNDLLLVLDNLMTSCPAFTSCIKLFFLWRGTENLRPVVNAVTEDWLRPKMLWEHQTMRKEAYAAKLFTMGGYVFVGGAYLGYVFAPIFGLNIRVITNTTDYGNRHLLVQSYYPYDYSKTPNYELTHLSQVLVGFFIIMAVAIPDNYFGALVFHLSAQFKILGISIEHFIQKSDRKLMGGRNKVLNKRLGMYVQRHVHLIRMVSALEETFNLLILIQLFCMCVMVCSLAFRILYVRIGSPGGCLISGTPISSKLYMGCEIKLKVSGFILRVKNIMQSFEGTGVPESIQRTDEKIPIFQTVNLAAALFSLMLFTLADCSASEVLSTHSSALFYHVYNCHWYTVPEQSSRNFILIMLMSGNPQILTAGKILPLSLSSYCAILKSIGGYLSVLIAASS